MHFRPQDTRRSFTSVHKWPANVRCRRRRTTRPPNGKPWRFHRATDQSDQSEVRRQSINSKFPNSDPPDRAFCVAAPRAWNRLPPDLRQLRSTQTFRRHLKTFFIHCFLLSSDKQTFMDYVMRRRSTCKRRIRNVVVTVTVREYTNKDAEYGATDACAM